MENAPGFLSWGSGPKSTGGAAGAREGGSSTERFVDHDARPAMEFGREVFDLPGNVTEVMSFAPNQLIKQGAKLVTGAEDDGIE